MAWALVLLTAVRGPHGQKNERHLMLRSQLFKTVLILSLTSPAFAQSQDENIVSVNGTRLDQTQTEIGSSISIITSEDMDALGFDFAVDAIASVPGVTVSQNSSFGGQAAIRIRGAGSEQTLTLINGVPVNDPSSPGGGFDYGRLDAANIARIEVLKGPQSTLWGSDAIGGVINIITKRAKDGMGIDGYAEYGSYNTFRGGGAIYGANDSSDFRLALTGTNSDGISKADSKNGNSEKDAYDAYTLSGHGGLNLGVARLDVSALYTDADTDFDSFVFGAQGNVGDGDESAQSKELSLNASVTIPLMGGKFDNMLLLGYSDIDRQNFSGNTPSFGAEGERHIFRYQGTANINAQNKIAFGYEREDINVGQDESAIDSLFALYEAKPIDNLTLTAGIRADDHSIFDSETTGRIAAAYNPTEAVTFRASWAEGFKAGYENIARAKSEGLEIFGDFDVTEWLNIGIDYAYIDARDDAGQDLLRIPEHSGDITLKFNANGPFSGAALLRYSGKQEDSTGQIDDWIRLDLNGAYSVNDSLELYGRIENLLDTEYQQVLGYGTPGLSGSLGMRFKY